MRRAVLLCGASQAADGLFTANTVILARCNLNVVFASNDCDSSGDRTIEQSGHACGDNPAAAPVPQRCILRRTQKARRNLPEPVSVPECARNNCPLLLSGTLTGNANNDP